MLALFLLLPVLGLCSLAGFFWLVAVAFRRSALWGVVVLLLSPIAAIAFAVGHWSESKRPFVLYFGGAFASAVLLCVAFVAAGTAAFKAAAENAEAAPAVEAPEPEVPAFHTAPTPPPEQPGATPEEPSAAAIVSALAKVEAESLTPPGSLAAGEGAPRRRRSERVSVDEVDHHYGEPLRIVTRDGAEFVGRFIDHDHGMLQFEKRIPAGTLVVHLREGDIRSLHQLKRR